MPDDRIVSYHEAGHCVAAYALQRSISSVELTPTGGEFKSFVPTAWETVPENRERFRDAVLQSLGPQHLDEMLPTMISLSAGLAAQRRIVGRVHDDYANADMEQCEAIARAVAPGAESELRLLEQELAERIVTRHWRQIEALAAELRLHRQLDAGQIAAVIERSAAQRLVYGYERRDGVTRPSANPDPLRAAYLYERRTDGGFK